MKTKNVNRYNVPSDWKVDNLGNVTNNFDSKRVPLSTMERSKKKGPFPYYGAAKIIDYIDDYIFDGEYCLIAEDGSVIKKNKTPFLQLLNGKFWPNNHTHVISAKHPLNNKYLFYYLSGIDISPFITGSAQPKINQKNLNKIPIVIPPKNIMNKNASILSNYDKLIENNTRRIEILEEMAQRIYKEWFINQESEERGILEIPYFTFLKQNIKKFDGFKRYYATADVEGTNFVKEGIDYDYKNKPSRAQKKPIINSVWFARMKDSYKIAAFTKANAFQAENTMLSSGFAGFSSKDIHFGFLYSTISSKVFDNLKNLYATGATQISLNNDGLSKIYVPYPNEEKVLEFCNIVNPIIDKSILLKNINKNLIETRDYLLPKIISGKVDVSDLDINMSILND